MSEYYGLTHLYLFTKFYIWDMGKISLCQKHSFI
jgi:hypothetical protein